MEKRPKDLLVRIGFAIIALLTCWIGIAPILQEDGVLFANWAKGLVYAPIVLFVGVLFLYVIIFKWDKRNKF